MKPEETTEDGELETQDPAEEAEETPEEEPEQTSGDEGKPLTYEQKLAAATTVEEKFAIANAEAAKNRRLLSKARKGTTPAPVAVTPNGATPSTVDVDERILKAQGMDDELLTQLKDVATLRKVSLIDAQTDPLFVAAKEQFEKDKRSKAASMSGSRGSGSPKVKKSLETPNLSREEHMRLVKGG